MSTSQQKPVPAPSRVSRHLREFEFPRRAEHETWMMMSGLIALCALVVVGVVVLPLLGPRVAAVTAVVVVTAIVLVCYLICVPRSAPRVDHTPRRTPS